MHTCFIINKNPVSNFFGVLGAHQPKLLLRLVPGLNVFHYLHVVDGKDGIRYV